MKTIFTLAVTLVLMSGTSCGNRSDNYHKNNKHSYALQKADSEWKKVLTPAAYEVMVKAGTEPAFHNAYFNYHQKGIYASAATGEPLFSSEDKFESGTGWPSFSKPINTKALIIVKDYSLIIERDEVVETKTGLHLGHVFNDGPADKGGMRYCINSAALKFIKK